MAEAAARGSQKSNSPCEGVNWPFVMRIVGAASGCAVLIIGIVHLLDFGDPKEFIGSIYQIVFGVLILLAEAHLKKLLNLFSFLKSYGGLGMFYLVVAGLALGSKIWEILIAICLGLVGFCYIIMGTCLRMKLSEDEEEDTKALPTPGMQPEAGTTEPVADYGSSYAAPEHVPPPKPVAPPKATGGGDGEWDSNPFEDTYA